MYIEGNLKIRCFSQKIHTLHDSHSVLNPFIILKSSKDLSKGKEEQEDSIWPARCLFSEEDALKRGSCQIF